MRSSEYGLASVRRPGESLSPESWNQPKGVAMDEQNATGANAGLSDDAASGLAYLTFIPAIIFLVVAPYNTNPKVKFHAWQSIFLAIAGFAAGVVLRIIAFIPIVNFVLLLLAPLVWLAILALALIAMIQAFQGKRFKIPVLGDFAEKQANG
jgi:uncharacterized membrane protein